MSYLIGFIINAIVAAALGAAAALISQLLPVRAADADVKWLARRKRAVGSFAVVWLGVVVYGCVDMMTPDHIALNGTQAAEVVPKAIRGAAKVLHAEGVIQDDTTRTYVVVSTTTAQMEGLAIAAQLRRRFYRPTIGSFRDGEMPAWWPTRLCADGILYDVDRWADPLSEVDYEVYWCPSEHRAYIRRFDY